MEPCPQGARIVVDPSLGNTGEDLHILTWKGGNVISHEQERHQNDTNNTNL